MNIKIDAGIGEILDKLSILEIKLIKIENKDKLKNIKYEYDILLDIINKNIDNNILNNEKYKNLLEVNNKLWNVEDKLRYLEKINNFNEEFIISARAVYILNDKRCYIKKLLNNQYSSNIIEEKSYISHEYKLQNNSLDNKLELFLNNI
jgi:hypothetical protein